MKALRRLLTVLIMAAGLFGCGPVPQPFRHDDVSQVPNPVDVLEGFRVIYVKPVEGPPAPMAALLADTVANYLNNRDLAAGVRQPKGLAHKYWTLVGRARPIPLDADPDVIAVTEWTLTDESGALVTTHEVRSTGEAWQWEYGDPRILYAIGEDVADALAKVVIKSMPQNTVDPADMGPKVVLGPVSGAPGDGNQSLLRALKTGLRMRGFHIAANDKAADKHIRCEVILTALKNGKENIKLIWSVLEADGTRIGDAVQENQIEAGSLNGRWGQVAGFAVEAVIDGLSGLLESEVNDGTHKGLEVPEMPEMRQLPQIPGRALPPPG